MENQTPSVQPSETSLPSQAPDTGGQPSVAMQIQQLLTQQQQLQQQYNQIVAQWQENPNKTPEAKSAVEMQLSPINAQYVKNQQALQALGYTTVQVNRPAEVKQGAKNNFSFKKLAIGCGFLLVFFVVGFGAILYFLKQNPNALVSVGISASTAKSLLTMFAGLLVGVIGLVGLGFLFSNIYRLITVKNQSKIGYILSLLVAVVILGIDGGIAAVVFGEIGKIDVEPVVMSTTLVNPHLVVKGHDDSDATSSADDLLGW
jgi:nitrate reductase gamma subunit